jgi:hypothetical protein
MTRIAKQRRDKTAKARAASMEARMKRADAWGPNLRPSSQSYRLAILPRDGARSRHAPAARRLLHTKSAHKGTVETFADLAGARYFCSWISGVCSSRGGARNVELP